jgi:hypothetical protein
VRDSSGCSPWVAQVARASAVIAAALFVLILVFVPPAQALVPPLNPDEPNDDFAAATPLSSGEIVWGVIPEDDDEDYFYLDLPGLRHVTVEFTTTGYFRECGLAFQAAGSDTIIDLTWSKRYDDDGSFFAEGVIGPGRLFAIVSLGSGEAGVPVYTIKATHADTGGSVFSDVPVGSEYYAPITYLADEDVVSGYADGKFGPHNLVTRQQFAKMIVRAVGYPVSNSDICEFVDVQTSYPGYYLDLNDPLYPDHYIAVAAERHITVGETPYAFGPYHNIKLAQVVTMVVRTGENLGVYDSPPHSYVPPFDDFGEPHYSHAREGAAHGLFDGYPGLWEWYSPATRGQCAFFIWKLMLAINGSSRAE